MEEADGGRAKRRQERIKQTETNRPLLKNNHIVRNVNYSDGLLINTSPQFNLQSLNFTLNNRKKIKLMRQDKIKLRVFFSL